MADTTPTMLTIPQLAAEMQVKESLLYERSRKRQLPGMVKFGRFVRVDKDRFYTVLREQEVNTPERSQP